MREKWKGGREKLGRRAGSFFLAFIQIHKEEEDKDAAPVDGRFNPRGILTA